MRFKINFTILALFYFVFEGNFQVQDPSPRGGGAYIWRGDLMEGFCIMSLGGLRYIWRGLYMEGLIFGILHHNEVSSLKNWQRKWP